MKITVIGTGYVGLVTGAVFSDWGNDVYCLDIDTNKLNEIKKGNMPIYEVGLKEVVLKNLENGNFKVTSDYALAVDHAEIILICVGTPSNQSGAADLSFVYKVAEQIGQNRKKDDYQVIVCKSTVPVGTNNEVRDIILQNTTNHNFDVLSNPEFLREGSAVYDANHLDRVVIGSDSKKALDTMAQIYEHLDTKIVKTDLASAELIKYASNAFLATKITFINEIAQICEKVGANVKDVSLGMGLDTRIGNKFLNAGIGFGGSCFPKDVEALHKTSSENLYDFKLLRGVLDANEDQRIFFTKKIFSKFGENLSGKTIGILGAAFKKDTDDVRKSVSVAIIKDLRGAGAKVKLYDPIALENAKHELGELSIEYSADHKDAFTNVDAVAILTEWDEFKEYDYVSLSTTMRNKVIFDGRNILDKSLMQNNGFEYYGVGV